MYVVGHASLIEGMSDFIEKGPSKNLPCNIFVGLLTKNLPL